MKLKRLGTLLQPWQDVVQCPQQVMEMKQAKMQVS